MLPPLNSPSWTLGPQTMPDLPLGRKLPEVLFYGGRQQGLKIGGAMRLMTVDMGVGGISCASCMATLETALGRVPGVASVSVNLATQRATMTL
jgi:hypothetical protein